MSGRALARAAAAWLAALALAACSAQPPPTLSGGAALPHFALSVPEALAWFEERTLKCLGPSAASQEAQEWLCRQEFQDGSTLEARITGDDAGVIQLVGVTTGLDAEDSANFLVSSVAILAVPMAERDRLELWSVGRQKGGGVIAIGPALVELRPHADSRAIVVSLRSMTCVSPSTSPSEPCQPSG